MLDKIMALGISEETAREILHDNRPAEYAIPCEIWSRPCGYFRPINQYNPGKVEEFWERKPVVIPAL
jgi:anaerobic ribonucleoside-triphosphate reductase